MSATKTFNPTQQQQAILDAFKLHHTLKIEACSGAGKTSTLKLLAESDTRPSLYIAYNKAMCKEAKTRFPRHVECRTIHSLAYAKFGVKLQPKLEAVRSKTNYVNMGVTNTEIANLFGINDICFSEDEIVSRVKIASFVKQTVNTYQNSADRNVKKEHVPYYSIVKLKDKVPMLNVYSVVQHCVALASKLFLLRCDLNSPVKPDHNTYLKLYQLSNPDLSHYNVIYTDEAQDINPVMYDIISKQHKSKRVYVGDTYQSIYAFNGAINALANIEAPSYPLTKSFRFGADIAQLATFILDEALIVEGLETLNTKIVQTVHQTEKKYTKIFRTNSALLDEAVYLIESGVKVSTDINTTSFITELESVNALYNDDRKGIKSEAIKFYDSYDELKEDAKDDVELKRMCRIVEAGKTHTFIKSISKIKKTGGDVFLTTAHKSKGLEWDNVVIANDFPIDTILLCQGESGFQQQEVNLFYVACTRVKKQLQLPPDFYEIYSQALSDFYADNEQEEQSIA